MLSHTGMTSTNLTTTELKRETVSKIHRLWNFIGPLILMALIKTWNRVEWCEMEWLVGWLFWV